MKIDGVRHITDKNELLDIFKKLFEQQAVMLKTESMNIHSTCIFIISVFNKTAGCHAENKEYEYTGRVY